MSKQRLLIKRPGNTNTCIPVTVEESDQVGNCISSLVKHLGLPQRDGLGRPLTYSLRPLEARSPLARTAHFSDIHLPPETRLILEQDGADTARSPAPVASPPTGWEHRAKDETVLLPAKQQVNRRTFLYTSVLMGCAAGGLMSGAATAFAMRGRVSPATPPLMPQMPARSNRLQQALLFSEHQQTVRALNWSPDGTLIASGADDARLLLWQPTGHVQQHIPQSSGISALAWSPAGQRLACSVGNNLLFFDGKTATSLAPARTAHRAPITSVIWLSAPGHPVVSGSLDTHAIVWETQQYQPQAAFLRHTTAINALAAFPNGSTVASASEGGVVRVWQHDTLAEVHGFYQDAPLPLRTASCARTGNQLVVGGNDGLVRIWNDGLVCQQMVTDAQGSRCADTALRFQVQATPVHAVAWSPNGRYLATGSEDGMFALWMMREGQPPSLFAAVPHPAPVLAVSWAPSGQQIAIASANTITLWNVVL